MQQSGFRSAPVTKAFLYSLVASSLLVSLLDVKHYFHIQIVPHLWVYRQFWRIAIWQTIYANAGELLFASLLLYHLRLVERLFGTRKFASFLVYNFLATSLVAPTILATVCRTLTWGKMNYLPPGPTPVLFALLAQYHATVPGVYKFKLLTTSTSTPPSTSPSSSSDGAEEQQQQQQPGVTLSDKFYVYVISTQLALCQPPGSILSAAIGWIIGYAWRYDLLPKSRWRVPGWMFKASGGAGEYEILRRRLREGEAVGEQQQEGGGAGGVQGSRPLVRQVLDQFRGAF